ncbi:sporulation protein Cse60 [Fictibacillus phosphorivorans]|uniref:Uncharacterized protein n=1 Tax=Fictibacillus phosphorivorans TaxID=1221500 RepID=A0A160IQV1_9BACL|nr:sporulation protein Cse60 [Fictibacillus phosphorivorans]ANC78212.1 hypothetical protein ABE65_015960 [Fictibacillus phosphorivorans]MQR95211.1 sporulation protein Cse60 [Fictibacillus phosphorivorans]
MIQVRIFDEDHEEDLEIAINEFLSIIPPEHVVDIKYQIAVCDNAHSEDDTMFSFSAMIIFKKSGSSK